MTIIPFDDRDGWIWMNGEFVPWREAKVHVLTHGLHYGSCVFEGERLYDGEIFKLTPHTKRLFRSAEILEMDIPFTVAEIDAACKETVARMGFENAYVRPVAFRGPEQMGVAGLGTRTHVAIAAWPWGAYLGDEGMQKGIRVKTSSFTRHHVNVNMCRAKSVTTYANSILAHQEVANDNYDEALLLDVDGYVAEGAGENIFIVKKGKLYTPDLTSCLEGITRDSVITLAKEMGIEVIEKRITRDEIYCAEEAFFTGTAAEVTPIRELDQRQIGAGSRGPITTLLQQAFFDCVAGKHPNHTDWLDYV